MLEFLKNHPFAVEAFFEKSFVLTFAVPKEQLQDLIPECLQLDTFQDQWAFIAIAMVQTKGLRPKGLPQFMGNDFFLIGYRVFVRYKNNAGRNLRGLYILKSETDKRKMQFLGNVFTHYQYTTTDISQKENVHLFEVQSNKSQFEVIFEQGTQNVELPKKSPFANWKEARRFAGPLPFTFTYNPENKQVLIIEGVRQNWKPKAVNIVHCHFSFLDELDLEGIVLANAFVIKEVPYSWKKGKAEIWKN